MDTVDAALLDAVGALFFTEAGAVAGQGQGPLLAINGLVDETADHGMLRGTDQVQILALDLVHHGIHLGEGHNALDHIAVHHERGDDVGEALVDHEVAGVGQHSFVQAGDVAQQVVEAVAGNTAGGIQIDTFKALHDVHMVRDGVIGHNRLAEALDLDVAAVIGTDGHAGVYHLGDRVHDLLDLSLQLGLFGLQLFQAVSLSGDLLLDFLGLGCLAGVLLGLAHQSTDLLGQLVAVGAQVAGLADGSAVLGIQLDDLVDQGQLGILELFADVFLDCLRIFTDKTNV